MVDVVALYGYDYDAEPEKIVATGLSAVSIFSATAPDVDVANDLIRRGILIIGVPRDEFIELFGDLATVAAVALDVPAYLLGKSSAPNNISFSDYSETSGAVVVEWSAADGDVKGWRVERLDGSNWVVVAVLDAETTRWTATEIEPGQKYSFRVCAVTSNGDSNYGYGYYRSPLAAPSGLTVTDYDAATNTATLNWRDNSSYETGFELAFLMNDDPDVEVDFVVFGIAGANETSATTPTLIPGFVYTFRVRVLSGGDASNYGYVTSAVT